jgi:hypothetical protein
MICRLFVFRRAETTDIAGEYSQVSATRITFRGFRRLTRFQSNFRPFMQQRTVIASKKTIN